MSFYIFETKLHQNKLKRTVLYQRPQHYPWFPSWNWSCNEPKIMCKTKVTFFSMYGLGLGLGLKPNHLQSKLNPNFYVRSWSWTWSWAQDHVQNKINPYFYVWSWSWTSLASKTMCKPNGTFISLYCLGYTLGLEPMMMCNAIGTLLSTYCLGLAPKTMHKQIEPSIIWSWSRNYWSRIHHWNQINMAFWLIDIKGWCEDQK